MAILLTICDLEHNRIAGYTATFSRMFTPKPSTCVQNMVKIVEYVIDALAVYTLDLMCETDTLVRMPRICTSITKISNFTVNWNHINKK